MFFCKSGGTENPKRSAIQEQANPKSQDDCRRDQLKIKYQLAKTTSPEDQKNTFADAFPKGSLTLEASLLLPLILLTVTAFYALFGFLLTETRMNSALQQAGRKLAAYTCVSEDGAGILTELSLRAMVFSEDGNRKTAEQFILNGTSGVSFFGSRYDSDRDLLVLRAGFYLKIPWLSGQGIRLRLSTQTVHRAWTGREDPGAEEEIVFITEQGTVYHTDLSCPHLKVTVLSADSDRIGKLRNRDGKIYYECERCRDSEPGSRVYYTAYGERFHYSRNCPGLRRSVQSVGISRVGTRNKCKTCIRREKQ